MSIRTMSRKKRLTITAAVTAALLVAGGGAAFAYWTAYGSGTGTATTGTTTNFTITSTTSGGSTGGSLTPGGPPQTITFTVTNPGAGKQKLSTITPTITSATAPNVFPTTGCTAADYYFGTPSVIYGEIAAGGTLSGSVTLTMNDSTTDQDGCKGLTIPVLITAG